MRMQKSEKIMVVILFMALGILVVADWMLDDSGWNSDAASGLSVEGVVLEISPTRTGENLIIHLDSVQTPIFVPRTGGAKAVQARVHLGDRIRVWGKLSDYKGQKEISVGRSEDIELLN